MNRLMTQVGTFVTLAPLCSGSVFSILENSTTDFGFYAFDDRAGGRRLRRLLGGIVTFVLLVLNGCGWIGAGDGKTYVTPDGYLGSIASNGPIALDVVYMDDSTSGIEGVVRLSWWYVFRVTVQNRARSEIRITYDQFTKVDVFGENSPALSLDDVLSYKSHLMGPLMSYQRRAIRRASWTSDPIAPGGFAVGYVFFPRGDSGNPPWKLNLDPNVDVLKDELVVSFPQVRQDYLANHAQREKDSDEQEVADEDTTEEEPDESVVKSDEATPSDEAESDVVAEDGAADESDDAADGEVAVDEEVADADESTQPEATDETSSAEVVDTAQDEEAASEGDDEPEIQDTSATDGEPDGDTTPVETVESDDQETSVVEDDSSSDDSASTDESPESP
jgi:hypothetical protein